MNGFCQKSPLYPVLKISMSHFNFCETQVSQSFPLPFWSSEHAFKGKTKKSKFYWDLWNAACSGFYTEGLQAMRNFLWKVKNNSPLTKKISWRWKCWILEWAALMVYGDRSCERGEELLSITAVKAFSCYFSMLCGVCSKSSSRPKGMTLFPETRVCLWRNICRAQTANGVASCTVSE